MQDKGMKAVQKTGSQWVKLSRGDGVHVVAPASACSRQTLSKVRSLLLSWGLRPFIPEDLLDGTDSLCANTDSKRWLHLKRALQSPRSSLVWCLRGGYGSARLLPFLSQLSPPGRFKLFVGMSDVTSLHVFLNQVWKWPALHASVLEAVVGDGAKPLSQRGTRELQALLWGQKRELRYSVVPVNRRALQMFKAGSSPCPGSSPGTGQKKDFGSFGPFDGGKPDHFAKRFGDPMANSASGLYSLCRGYQ